MDVPTSYDDVLIPSETWISTKVELRSSLIHGQGTYARAVIAARETVEIWGRCWLGELTVKYTADAVEARRAASAGLVVTQWDDSLFSIERDGSDPGYFINHSCDSNLRFRNAFTLVARRAVLAGEELTLDYALVEADEDFRPGWRCRCASPSCRRNVTGSDWKRQNLQVRYAGHFSPLLNKPIAAMRNGR